MMRRRAAIALARISSCSDGSPVPMTSTARRTPCTAQRSAHRSAPSGLSRRLSLAEVAEATRISPSFLSLVELGKSDITIGRLVRLAEFYGVSFTDLLGGRGGDATAGVIVHAHEQRLLHSPAEGIDVYLLAADTDSAR